MTREAYERYVVRHYPRLVKYMEGRIDEPRDVVHDAIITGYEEYPEIYPADDEYVFRWLLSKVQRAIWAVYGRYVTERYARAPLGVITYQDSPLEQMLEAELHEHQRKQIQIWNNLPKQLWVEKKRYYRNQYVRAFHSY